MSEKVKALGVGLGAGVRRNVDVAKHRLKTMKSRVPRFRRLRKLGVSTSRLLRTGAKAAMTYGQAILGVSNSLLRDQRRTAAGIAATGAGVGGQNLDLALIIADENARTGADPAFDAHIMPIGDWATAVWERWMPERAMERLTAKAKMRLKKAKNVWAVVKGPAAAMVASCHRLGWTVISSTELRTDQGETLDLLLDSPAAVKLEIARAVKRWRWRNIEEKMPQLKKGGSGSGALMEPITKLLKSKSNNEDWNPALRGSLRSAIAGRQYPQARVFAAGWADHGKCLFCLHKLASVGARTARRTRINGKTKQLEASVRNKARYKVEATTEMITEAPVGSLGHRIWKCQSDWMTTQRKKWAPDRDVATVEQCDVGGHPAWERALQPRPSRPMKEAAKEASFRWVVEPAGGMIEGTAYSDGSFLDGPIAELARGGWAFAVLDDNGKVVASAYGVPPPWIKDIGGAEAWAVLQVGLRAVPGKVKFMIDCQPCVYMIHGGVKAATSADRPLARVNAMVMSVLEDVPNEKVVWMPAHKSKQAAGQFRCSNGEAITEWDIKGNAEADRLAKLAVGQHRVARAEVQYWERLCKQTMETAKWIARATWAASNCEEAPYRDTEASQWRADVSKGEAKARKEAAAAAAAQEEKDVAVDNLRGPHPSQSASIIRDKKRLEVHDMQKHVFLEKAAYQH